MSATDQPSEEELRAAYEAEIKKIRVEQILLEQIVTLINLGMRRTGVAPGTEDERDPEQVRTAVEAVRALLGLVESTAGMPSAQLDPIREALSQMQLAYVRMGESTAGEPGGARTGAPGAPTAPNGPGGEPDAAAAPPGPTPPGSEPDSDPSQPGEPGPAQRSGRLWVPGQ